MILLIIILSVFVTANESDKAIKAYNNKNFKQAFGHFKNSAKTGNLMSQYHLALMYEQGKGVERDVSKAIYWHNIAAERGHALALYSLAKKYLKGVYVLKDTPKALELYEKSASKGYSLAQHDLAILYINGNIVIRDFKKAKSLISKSYEGGYKQARLVWKKYKLWKY